MTDLRREVLLKCTLNFEKHDAVKISEFTENSNNIDSKIYLMGSICAINELLPNKESLQKEIAELKAQLEIAKEAFSKINKIVGSLPFSDNDKWGSELEIIWGISKRQLVTMGE